MSLFFFLIRVMKNILIAGAGKSSTSLIRYMLLHSETEQWLVTVMDSNMEAILEKTDGHPNGKAAVINIMDQSERQALVANADIVLSVMPPHLHFLLAQDCLQFNKHLITSSYVSEDIKSLHQAAQTQNLLFMCEMGCDPGIDHMSTAKIFDEIHQKGGVIKTFRSYCGGLVAPESDNNLWHYKVSWNPHNIVHAAKLGAVWLENNQIQERTYEQIFHNPGAFNIKGLSNLSAYPNRDSLKYKEIFHIPQIETFERATLRHENYMHGWAKVIDLNLTDETKVYTIENSTYKQWLAQHTGVAVADLENVLTEQYQFTQLTFDLFNEIGLLSDDLIPTTGTEVNASQILQAVIEKYWKLADDDKDMIVMQHLVNYTLNGTEHLHESSLIVIGEDRLQTAMAKTVGLPMAILAHLMLNNKIDTTLINGVQIPIQQPIYEQVLQLLEKQDILFESIEN